VAVPLSSWRSTSWATKNPRREDTNCWTAGASSRISSDITTDVATLRTVSSAVMNPNVDSGFCPASGTPAAPLVAVPSMT